MPLRERLCLLAAAVSAVVLHELGHAASALAFGDDTAKRDGRITLNPWKINPFGALILPALMVFTTGYPIAFASTPVNPSRMRNPRLHSMLCSLAGPGVNIVLIVAATAVLSAGGSHHLRGFLLDPSWPLWYLFAYSVGFVNVILAVFNLLPIPPLDGSAIVERFLPSRHAEGWAKFRQYGFGILILLLLLDRQGRVFGAVLNPFLNLWLGAWAPGFRFH